MNRINLNLYFLTIYFVHIANSNSIQRCENLNANIFTKQFQDHRESEYNNISNAIQYCLAMRKTKNVGIIAALIYKYYSENDNQINLDQIPNFLNIYTLTTDNICSEQIEQLVRFFKNNVQVFKYHFEKLISNSTMFVKTEDSDCFTNLLNFLENITNEMVLCDQINVYELLHEKVNEYAAEEKNKRTEYVLSIAGKLKLIDLSHQKYSNEHITTGPDQFEQCTGYNRLLKNFLNKLPSNVKNLFWTEISIKDAKNGYAVWASYKIENNRERTIEMQEISDILENSGAGDLLPRSRWTINVYNYTNREVQIQNAFTQEKLYATNVYINYCCTKRRAALTYANSDPFYFNVDESIWVLMPRNDDLTNFFIRNKYSSEFLMSGRMQNFVFDKDDVFTDTYKTVPVSEWTIGNLN